MKPQPTQQTGAHFRPSTHGSACSAAPRPWLALLVAGCVLAAGVAVAAEAPPRDLHQVDDHWTAWDPPRPPEGAEVHWIERGDTLWDLAARYYGDPYLWPQLWEQNRYILDAHWIYPGDPLLIGLQVEEVDSLAELAEPAEAGMEITEGEDGTAADGSGVLTAAEAARPPQPLGSQSDIYCSGFIGPLDRPFPNAIVGSEYEALAPDLRPIQTGPAYSTDFGNQTVRYGLMTGDIVYLDGGRAAGMGPGQVFTAVQADERVIHPLTEKVLGRFYRYSGRVRVLSVQDETAIAEIVHACDPVTVGAFLLPFEPVPVPLGRPGNARPVNYPTAAENLVGAPVIVRAEDDVITMGEGSVVYIDRGEMDDVIPGDVYTIYRMNRTGLPPVVLGEMAVLAVHEQSAIGRILSSRFAVRLGDRLERK